MSRPKKNSKKISIPPSKKPLRRKEELNRRRKSTARKKRGMIKGDIEAEEAGLEAKEERLQVKKTMEGILVPSMEKRSQEESSKEAMMMSRTASKMHTLSLQEEVDRSPVEEEQKEREEEKLHLTTRMISLHCDESADILLLSSG